MGEDLRKPSSAMPKEIVASMSFRHGAWRAKVLFSLGLALYFKHKFDDSIAFLLKAHGLDPEDLEILYKNALKVNP